MRCAVLAAIFVIANARRTITIVDAPSSAQTHVASGGCSASSVLAVTYSAGSDGDGRMYGNLFTYGLFQVQDGDAFEYEMMWREPDCNCATEFEVGSEYRLRDHGPPDARYFVPHVEHNHNMSQAVTRKWYTRSWPLTAITGKYIDKWVFSAALKPGQQRTAYFRKIRVRDAQGETRKAIWAPGTQALTINAYFPGSIASTCQEPVVADVPNWHIRQSAGVWSMFAEVRAAPIDHQPSSALCGRSVLVDLGRLWREQAASQTVLTSYTVRLRHRRHPDVTLWTLSNVSARMPTPWLVATAFDSMQEHALGKLLRDAEVEVNATTETHELRQAGNVFTAPLWV